jgi:hypothetical protein
MFRLTTQCGAFAFALAVAATGFAPQADAQDAGAGVSGKADSTHSESRRVNQTNTRAIHAGPGAPAVGTVFVPPAQEKREGRK